MFYPNRELSMCKTSIVWILLQALLFLRSTHFGQADSFSMKVNQRSVPTVTSSTVACGIRAFTSSEQSYRNTDNISVLQDGHNMDRIVGGNGAVRGEIPWQANIKKKRLINGRKRYTHSCGAAIISEFWLLSAAHCFYEINPVYVRVIVGNHQMFGADKQQIWKVDKIIIHAEHKEKEHYYDIALIKIKPTQNGRGIRFNTAVQPICLPDSTEHLAVGTKLLVSGWGQYSTDGTKSSMVLQTTLLPVISPDLCKQLFHKHFRDHMVCAGYVNGTTSVCKGDSGGPAAYKSGGIYILYGIVAYGTGCLLPRYPAVFSSVPAFRSWIESSIIANSDNDRQKVIPGRPVINH